MRACHVGFRSGSAPPFKAAGVQLTLRSGISKILSETPSPNALKWLICFFRMIIRPSPIAHMHSWSAKV